jgi:hypothetical protein
MNIPLLLSALWRFRALVIAGACLALVLAFLSYNRVSFDGGIKTEPRQSEEWSSVATVFVTQEGFPWGRSYLLYETAGDLPPIMLGDPARFAQLAVLYTELANSDGVREILQRNGGIQGTLQAVTVLPEADSEPLPLIRLAATSTTEAGAIALGQRYTDAFQQYLRSQQQRAAIPSDQRVMIEVTQSASSATLIAGRSKMMALVIFITVMGAVLGLALVLENIKPRVPLQVVDPPRPAARKSTAA